MHISFNSSVKIQSFSSSKYYLLIFSFWQHTALLASHHTPRFHQTRLSSVTATMTSAVLDNVCFSTSCAIVPEPISTRLCRKYTHSQFLTEAESRLSQTEIQTVFRLKHPGQTQDLQHSKFRSITYRHP